jgi:hypothetical protein
MVRGGPRESPGPVVTRNAAKVRRVGGGMMRVAASDRHRIGEPLLSIPP